MLNVLKMYQEQRGKVTPFANSISGKSQLETDNEEKQKLFQCHGSMSDSVKCKLGKGKI